MKHTVAVIKRVKLRMEFIRCLNEGPAGLKSKEDVMVPISFPDFSSLFGSRKDMYGGPPDVDDRGIKLPPPLDIDKIRRELLQQQQKREAQAQAQAPGGTTIGGAAGVGTVPMGIGGLEEELDDPTQRTKVDVAVDKIIAGLE